MTNPSEILKKAEYYRPDMLQFLRDLCAIPSESGKEREVAQRIRREMEGVGFDEIKFDGMGNVLGRIGSGRHVLAMDGHIDTVGIGDRASWKWDPFEGKLENGIFYARGASDQKGGMAGMVYGAKIIKDLGLAGDYSLWIAGTVQEEDCDGLCWQYILNEGVLKPEVVILTEPTNLAIYRGHRGRMEIGVTTHGISCHGSAPERGKNAIYMMSGIIGQIEQLNDRLPADEFLGKGTVTVTYIECSTPSVCAVPDRAYIHVDRRLTRGETKESAVAEVRDAIRRAGVEADVEVLKYDVPSYTNLVYRTEKYYPTWTLDPAHRACRAAVENYRTLFGEDPAMGKWAFSTNGIATMGLIGLPTIGFGPGNEVHAHAITDQMPADHLVRAAAFYAGFPLAYCAIA
ncbi:MAG TPA: YgeY family selenium metabolism-linked hydrolase [Acidobacteriota bacterium]|nr:YgeY family selenium metabolism-linked hydrolase [Acidobacteriota bacterium]